MAKNFVQEGKALNYTAGADSNSQLRVYRQTTELS